MEFPMYVTSTAHISLNKILELQDRPVSEEQAWALCYQLCTILCERRGNYYTCRRMLQLPAVNHILLISDGNVRLRMDDGTTGRGKKSSNGRNLKAFIFLLDFLAYGTEDEMVDHLGRLIYACLDWGLDSSVERELNETLELLLCQMTKVNLNQSLQEPFQPLYTLSDVIQICENRLYEPDQAAHHYRSICAALFSETMELYQYFHNIQLNKNALQKMAIEPDARNVSQGATHRVFAWRQLMEDFGRGVTLRPVDCLNVSAPLPVKRSPFQQLLVDIKLKRYKLRKVQTVGKRYLMSGHQKALLKAISSRPKLRPVSERKLKPRPKEEASLHELLMEDIRSVDQKKLLSSRKKRFPDKDNCLSTTPIPFGEDSTAEEVSFCLRPIPAPDIQEAESEEEPFKNEVFQLANSGVEPELKFLPAVSSSPLNPLGGTSRRKSRCCSLDSHLEVSKLALLKKKRSCAKLLKVKIPLTISDVIKRRQMEMRTFRTEYSDRCRKWRVCSACSKTSLYFTWHNCCSLCNRVVCLECCVKMHLPFERCVNLPVSFFKKIVLNHDCERDVSNFWRERLTWDHTRIPLVLESPNTNAVPQPALAMRDWYSQDLCTDCKSAVMEACDSTFSLKTGPVSKEI